MRCIDPVDHLDTPGARPAVRLRPSSLRAAIGLLGAALLVAGCGSPALQRPTPAPGQPLPSGTAPRAEPGAPQTGTGTGTGTGGQALAQPRLPWPAFDRARNWADYRVMAARRIVAANPAGSHMGEVVQPLLAIPVLEIELHADGSLRRVGVLRQPSQARDTVQLAIDAVKRAAPFAPVGHLPPPWKFSEVFLFNEQRLFKPRTLDD